MELAVSSSERYTAILRAQRAREDVVQMTDQLRELDGAGEEAARPTNGPLVVVRLSVEVAVEARWTAALIGWKDTATRRASTISRIGMRCSSSWKRAFDQRSSPSNAHPATPTATRYTAPRLITTRMSMSRCRTMAWPTIAIMISEKKGPYLPRSEARKIRGTSTFVAVAITIGRDNATTRKRSCRRRSSADRLYLPTRTQMANPKPVMRYSAYRG
jgi:hypothetical protein